MKKIERFTTQHPIVFGFVLILLFSLLSALTWPISQLYPYPEGSELSDALSKIIIAAFFVGLLWRLGWLERAGYGHVGEKRIWLIVIPLIVYKVILSIYVFSGAFTLQFPGWSLALAIVFYSLTTSLLEESMYRGLLLTAMLKSWGHSRRGVLLSALVSGLFWGCLHLFNLIIRPFPVVCLQVLGTTLVGFYYAAFVISSRSIWPAVLFHWVTNASINLALSQNPNFEETITHWIWYALLSLLPFLVSLWTLKPSRSVNAVPSKPDGREKLATWL